MTEDGGSAFPAAAGTATDMEIDYGMSLRDYFAGQVLASMFSRSFPRDIDADYLRQHGAKAVYEVADAMLKARKEASNDGS